jgi:hypothetical protein
MESPIKPKTCKKKIHKGKRDNIYKQRSHLRLK